jgi:hypothetical protein
LAQEARRQVRPRLDQPFGPTPGGSATVDERFPEKGLDLLMRPTLLTETTCVPLQPADPNNRTPEESPEGGTILQIRGET